MKIYYTKISDVPAVYEDDRLLSKLPAERLERIRRMKNATKRCQSIAAGLLLEYALRMQKMTGVGKTFGTHEGGKPYILEYPEVYYNLSHSGVYVAVVLDDRSVGIDVEILRYNQQKLAKRFFSIEENAVLEQTWSDSVFTQIWTRKEAYLKALGTGLRVATDSFVVLNEQVRRLESHRVVEGLDSDYYLETVSLGEDGWCSVCRKDSRVDAKPQYVDLMVEFL